MAEVLDINTVSELNCEEPKPLPKNWPQVCPEDPVFSAADGVELRYGAASVSRLPGFAPAPREPDLALRS